MKTLLPVLCLFILSTQLIAQIKYDTLNFDENPFTQGWTASTHVPPVLSWGHTTTGISDGPNWNDRSPLASLTPNNGLIHDGDRIWDVASPQPTTFVATSNGIAYDNVPTAGDRIGLRFRQYFRNFAGSCSIGLSSDGMNWTDFSVNENIGAGVETLNELAYNEILIDVTEANLTGDQYFIRFTVEGSVYFWIIDDVELIQLEPGIGLTFPVELGDSLNAWNIPFLVDSLGGAYPPNELVVQWVDGLSEQDKQDTRDDLGVTSFEVCECDELELFRFPTEISLADSINQITNGDFSDGNVGFTSELSENCSCIWDSYCVVSQMIDKCSSWTSGTFPDVDGDGLFLAVDGAITDGSDVWCQNGLELNSNEKYVVVFRTRNLPSGASNPFPELQVFVNGNSLNTPVITVDTDDEWVQQVVQFTYMGTATINGELCIRQVNSNLGDIGGFDYGIDDIFLGEFTNELGPVGPIEEKKDKGKAMPGKIEEIDFNYYNFDIEELKDTTPVVGNIFPDDTGTPPGEVDDVVVAVLDTGVDYEYSEVSPQLPLGFLDIDKFMWENPAGDACFPMDSKGWNFVHGDDLNLQHKPFDDHGHGTHVAGILINEWFKFTQETEIDENCCDLKILPVKTHDFHGLGTLFNVTCGIYYAREMGADIINASWGFTAVQDPDGGILHNAIDDVKPVLIVTSAGNEGVDISSTVPGMIHPNYPSSYDLGNIVTVGAMNADNNLWINSNFSNTQVHYGAPGVEIISSIPEGTDPIDPIAIVGMKDGTSMAAPVVSAYSALLACMDNVSGYLDVKLYLNELGIGIVGNPPMSTDWEAVTITGKQMNLGVTIGSINDQKCILEPLSTNALSVGVDISVSPNPTSKGVQLQVVDNTIPIQMIRLFDVTGQEIRNWPMNFNQGSLNMEIDFQQYPAGMYYLSILTERGVHSESIIKQ